jgi:hypothetical protein
MSTPTITTPAVIETTTPIAEPQIVSFQDQNPSNWEIIKKTEEGVVAYNPVSKETFEGTLKVFNAQMKG